MFVLTGSVDVRELLNKNNAILFSSTLALWQVHDKWIVEVVCVYVWDTFKNPSMCFEAVFKSVYCQLAFCVSVKVFWLPVNSQYYCTTSHRIATCHLIPSQRVAAMHLHHPMWNGVLLCNINYICYNKLQFQSRAGHKRGFVKRQNQKTTRPRYIAADMPKQKQRM